MESRLEILSGQPKDGNTLYIMRRDQRIFQNYCVEYGYSLSNNFKKEFLIGLDFDTFKANEHQEKIIYEGLEEMLESSASLNIPLISLNIKDLHSIIKSYTITNVILDYCPLRESIQLTKSISKMCLDIYCVQIDAHNVVPHVLLDVYKRNSRAVKITLFKHFFEYLKKFEDIKRHKYNKTNSNLKIPEYERHKYFRGGYSHGMNQVKHFFDTKFNLYADKRNNPDLNIISDLSPYLHPGQVSSQQILLMAYDRFYNKDDKNLESFVNEVFVWKETAEHFCYHEPNYDNIDGALPWAKETLLSHKDDRRERIYSKKDLEIGKTQSMLWNAGQMELVNFNKMHGYVRMFWAKQLLKWTLTPEEALGMAIEFNDKYSLDGNDPNGYLGVMWSICGTMDQGWKERLITGKIRPMKEFKTKEYVARWTNKKERDAYLKSREI